MEKHSCKTYFSVEFEIDTAKNAALLKERRSCSPEEIGIFNRGEVEKFIKETFGVEPKWNRHRFVIGLNESYSCDVNDMLAVTLKNLYGKEDKIREMQKMFSVSTVLEIVPYIVSNSEQPKQILSLNGDIINFLSTSGTSLDLDYYVI